MSIQTDVQICIGDTPTTQLQAVQKHLVVYVGTEFEAKARQVNHLIMYELFKREFHEQATVGGGIK